MTTFTRYCGDRSSPFIVVWNTYKIKIHLKNLITDQMTIDGFIALVDRTKTLPRVDLSLRYAPSEIDLNVYSIVSNGTIHY